MKRWTLLSLLFALGLAASTCIAQLPPPDKAKAEAAEHARTLATLALPNVKALRAAITFLQVTYGSRYPRGAEFLDQLAALEKVPNATALAALQREALIANPLVSGQPILFATHYQ